MAIKEITVDSIERFPLNPPNFDLISLITGLAADLKTLERRVEELERKLIHVRADRQGHDNQDQSK